MSFLLVVPFFVTRCHSLSFVVTRYHLLSLVVPLVFTRCHSLSFTVTRCHSLSVVIPLVVPLAFTRCHSLSLVVTRRTFRLSFYKRCVNNRPRLCTLYLPLFYLLASPVKDHLKYQRRKFLQQQKAVNQDYFIHLRYP